jgi:hypothetical protein
MHPFATVRQSPDAKVLGKDKISATLQQWIIVPAANTWQTIAVDRI